MTRVLLVTADPLLVDELVRLAAGAGCAYEHAPDIGSALPAWTRAAAVVVGADVLPALAGLAPPRRPGVCVVSWGEAGDDLFKPALQVGAESVVELPRGAELVAELLTDLGESSGPGLVIGVVGGAGGAGASVFAAALGQVAAREHAVAVVDADPFGPGLDRVMGLDEQPGVRWGDLTTVGRLGARALREALPRRRGLSVLTWGRGAAVAPEPQVVRSVLSAARRGHDLVVVDLPRVAISDEVVARCDLVLVVVPATISGVSSSLRLVATMPERDRLFALVRGLAMDQAEVARVLEVPVLARMPDQRGLDEVIDLGLGPVRSRRGPLGRTASLILERCRMQGAR